MEGSFFTVLFDRLKRKPVLPEDNKKGELVAPETEAAKDIVSEKHVVFSVDMSNVVTYTVIHCDSNISEGELKWTDCMNAEMSADDVAEDFMDWLRLRHQKARFKYTRFSD